MVTDVLVSDRLVEYSVVLRVLFLELLGVECTLETCEEINSLELQPQRVSISALGWSVATVGSPSPASQARPRPARTLCSETLFHHHRGFMVQAARALGTLLTSEEEILCVLAILQPKKPMSRATKSLAQSPMAKK